MKKEIKEHNGKLYEKEADGTFIELKHIEVINRTYSLIQVELKRAEKKHPDFPSDMFRQVAIMNEESGEVTKAVLDFHYENGSLQDVKDELIQTAAMCVRMFNALQKPVNIRQKIAGLIVADELELKATMCELFQVHCNNCNQDYMSDHQHICHEDTKAYK